MPRTCPHLPRPERRCAQAKEGSSHRPARLATVGIMDLPDCLLERPFTIDDGRRLGLTERQLRSPALSRPTRGVRSVAAPGELLDRMRAIALVLPSDAAFSHLTAARLHGWPLSYAMEEDNRLHVVRRIDRAHIRRTGVVGHRNLHPREFVTLCGLPAVGAADTWVDLGELVGGGKPVGLDDLIVAGDAAVALLGSVAPLRAAVARRVRPRGKRTMLEAIPWIRVGSASARETTARLMLVRSGLPEPRLNRPIFASWDPDLLLAVGDLVWEHSLANGTLVKVIGEYQGAEWHSTDDQRRRDGIRRQGLENDGWVVEEIWNEDMSTTDARHGTVRRFAGALCVPEDLLDLQASEPRFFSRHAVEVALQRDALQGLRHASPYPSADGRY